jgi:peptidoglycan hydrolase-like protein with peptidoglycan-binding domain
MAGAVLGLSACNMAGDQQPPRVSAARAQADREAVAHVQTQLAQLGYYRGAIDGVWGTESRAAIAAFQRASGLAPTGQPDQATLNALSSSGATAANQMPPANPPPPAMSAPPPPATAQAPAGSSVPSGAVPSIAQVQQGLQQMGYYRGRIDGRWGPGTRSAMAQFQRSQGLPVTGQGDMASLNALMNASSGGSGAVPPAGTYR